MGVIALLQSFKRVIKNGAKYAEGTVDVGGVNLKTSPHFAAPGDDSHPVVGDYPVAVEIPHRGGVATVGYVDPKNAGITAPGEVRRYARNEGGEPQGHMHLKADQTNILSNDKVSLTQNPDGTYEVKNLVSALTMDASGTNTLENPLSSLTMDDTGRNTLTNTTSTFIQTLDGFTVITNGPGLLVLDPLGVFTINGTRFLPGGIIEGVNSLKDNSAREYVPHIHPAGTPPGNTGTNI